MLYGSIIDLISAIEISKICWPSVESRLATRQFGYGAISSDWSMFGVWRSSTRAMEIHFSLMRSSWGLMVNSIIYSALSIRTAKSSMCYYSVEATARPLSVSSNDYWRHIEWTPERSWRTSWEVTASHIMNWFQNRFMIVPTVYSCALILLEFLRSAV